MMREKNLLLSFIFIFIFSVPVFASGNLTVTGSSMAPVYTNTNTSVEVLNITMDASIGTVTITALELYVNQNPGNISVISVRNSTNGVVFASNSTFNTTTNTTILNFTSPVTVITTENTSLIVVMNITLSATPSTNISVNITSDASFTVDNNSNVFITANSLQSDGMQIQDVHATAVLSPLFADTNVVNQTMTYTITKTGDNPANRTVIAVPQNNIDHVTTITHGSTLLYNTSGNQTANTSVSVLSNRIEINFSQGFTNTFQINFTINTGNGNTNNISANLSGSNLTNIATNVAGTNTTLSTKQLIQSITVNITKGTAIVNNTDYWEFKLILSFTDSIPSGGVIQFNMNNWSDTSGNTLNITSGNTNYATLRGAASFSTTNKINVLGTYNETSGVTHTPIAGTLFTTYLRMIIPTGTVSSDSWSTTYNMLFRVNP